MTGNCALCGRKVRNLYRLFDGLVCLGCAIAADKKENKDD